MFKNTSSCWGANELLDVSVMICYTKKSEWSFEKWFFATKPNTNKKEDKTTMYLIK